MPAQQQRRTRGTPVLPVWRFCMQHIGLPNVGSPPLPRNSCNPSLASRFCCSGWSRLSIVGDSQIIPNILLCGHPQGEHAAPFFSSGSSITRNTAPLRDCATSSYSSDMTGFDAIVPATLAAFCGLLEKLLNFSTRIFMRKSQFYWHYAPSCDRPV